MGNVTFRTMKGLVESVKAALKYRGGWKGLYEHMYTNGDYPFKFGTYMGCDAAGNRYYENRVDYTFGQHRWVEPADIHNYDSTMIPPEWHGWMTSMNDSPPTQDEVFFEKGKENTIVSCISNANVDHAVGYQNKVENFHFMHNQSQIRSRGYNIGNPVVGLPPGAKDAFYTQPASPYNEASIRKTEMIGDLDEAKGGGRPYKSEKWADRLRTPEEKHAFENKYAAEHAKLMSQTNIEVERINRKKMMKSRGRGTVVGA